MKVLVISGFLGAGKTTFIQELIRRTGRDFVIYENEYGEADVDARRLRADSDLKVWESVENCICCSGKQDFAASILTISSSLDPDYLIVEPTGVARLSNVMENIQQVSWERIELLPPVTIVDALSCDAQHTSAADVFDDQVAHASIIVASKVSSLGSADRVITYANELNPEASLISGDYHSLSDEWWFSLLDGAPLTYKQAETSQIPSASQNPAVHDMPETDMPETLALEHVELASPEQLFWVLDALSAGVFGHIQRAKGSLPCGNQALRFDVVERTWAVTGAEASDDTRVVFIGEELKRSWLREVFVPALWQDEAEIHHEHSHKHTHAHEHSHDHEHHQDNGYDHEYHHAHDYEHDHAHDYRHRHAQPTKSSHENVHAH